MNWDAIIAVSEVLGVVAVVVTLLYLVGETRKNAQAIDATSSRKACYKISDWHLELARDRDGKPVDVLEINGDISDRRAELIEDLLWNLIPEAGHLRDQVGRIDVGNGARTSHPLALTQLLVGYHAVKAAMGIRAY